MRARNCPEAAGFGKAEQPFLDLLKKARRKGAISDDARAAGNGPEVRTGPHKAVDLAADDPGLFGVQPQALFGRQGNFNGRCGIEGRSMRDRANLAKISATLVGN